MMIDPTPPDLDPLFATGGLRVFFQPIFEAAGEEMRLHALECLCRGPVGTPLERGDALFRCVRTMKQEGAVDRHCILSALREASRLPSSLQMHINVHAATIARDCDLAKFIGWSARAHEVQTSRIVIEVVHLGPEADEPLFRRRIEELREIGLRMAIDDFGVGSGSHRNIVDLHPEYLKIDRWFVAGADRDRSRQAVLRSIVALGAGCRSRVIAEGVELGVEFAAVREAGIDLVQGFLLAAPREGSALRLEPEMIPVVS